MDFADPGVQGSCLLLCTGSVYYGARGVFNTVQGECSIRCRGRELFPCKKCLPVSAFYYRI